eukprot:8912016-Lingulodinium_polyedra.AAC.1
MYLTDKQASKQARQPSSKQTSKQANKQTACKRIGNVLLQAFAQEIPLRDETRCRNASLAARVLDES